MKKDLLAEVIKIAEIHAEKINDALERLKHCFPLSAQYVQQMPEQDFLWIELLVARFSKLQDLMGRKVIDAFLDHHGELIEDFTLIDKLHRLERLGVLDDAYRWQQMREVRNHLTHEYPNHPELTAKYLNQLFELTPKLLDILAAIKKRT